MARRGIELALALFLMAMLLVQTSAQSSCTPAVVSLSPCLAYITGNSSTPPSSCCSQLASIVQTQAQCLCTVFNGAAAQQFGTIINQTQALNLPNICNIQSPSLGNCDAATPAPTSPVSPSTPSVPNAASPTAASTPSVPGASSPDAPLTPAVPSDAAPTTPSTPSVPGIPSGTGSKTVPTTGVSSAATSSSRMSPAFFFFLLLGGSYASAFSIS